MSERKHAPSNCISRSGKFRSSRVSFEAWEAFGQSLSALSVGPRTRAWIDHEPSHTFRARRPPRHRPSRRSLTGWNSTAEIQKIQKVSRRTPRTRSSSVQGKLFQLLQRQRRLRLDCREARMLPLRQWCIQAERDAGEQPGRSSADKAKIKEFEREVKEFRTANERS